MLAVLQTVIITASIPSVLQPVVTSQLGTINNLIHVKKSDFEVFDALQVDSLDSDTSGQLFFELFPFIINIYLESVSCFL